jgi:hypothetical protein
MSYFSAVSDSFGFSHSRPCRGDALADEGDERACRVGRLAAQDGQLRLRVRARATAASAPVPAAAISSRSHASTDRTDE